MPRTKAPKKKKASIKGGTAEINKLISTLKTIEIMKTAFKERLDTELTVLLHKYKFYSMEQMLAIPPAFKNKTLKEIPDLHKRYNQCHRLSLRTCKKAATSTDWLSTIVGVTSFFNSTVQSTKKKLKRSTSFVDDEGYNTVESSSGTSGPGRSRRSAKKAVNSTTRGSRSLSRTHLQRTQTNSNKTPSHKMPPPSYGTVTPKMKPNTPQVVLRRPMQGEVVLSLQGSPLFTGRVVNETVANVNIPLLDGRLLSIQPQKGLRMSQIPTLDADTKRQLETLRDNLNKVCALSGRH